MFKIFKNQIITRILNMYRFVIQLKKNISNEEILYSLFRYYILKVCLYPRPCYAGRIFILRIQLKKSVFEN